MKTINTYISESFRLRDDTKLKMNQKFKNWSDIDGSYVYLLCFDLIHHGTFHVNKYNVLDVNKVKDDEYKIRLENKNIYQTFTYDEDANVLYKQNEYNIREVKFLIHPKDHDRLTRLYKNIDKLNKDIDYSMCNILRLFNITCTFLWDSVYHKQTYYCEDDEVTKKRLKNELSKTINKIIINTNNKNKL